MRWLAPCFSCVLPISFSAAALASQPSAAPGLLAEYRFETLEGGRVVDETSKWPGRLRGEAALAQGHSGRAIRLEGKGFVEIPGTERLTFLRGISIEAWIFPQTLSAGRIVDQATPGSSDGFCLDTHPGDAVRFITPVGTLSASKALAAGKWTHVIAVYDPDGPELAIYVDGKLAACQPCSRVARPGRHAIHVGSDPEGGNQFRGRIDDVRLYGIALMNEDAAARFAGKDPRPAVAPANELAPVMYRDGPQVSHAALLARNDVVYLSPAVYEHEALPVGNGTLCGMVWNGDGIDVQVNHAANVWHQTASGRVLLRTEPPLAAGITRFEQRLSLYDGAVRMKCSGEAGDWQATVAALNGIDVLAIHLEGRLRGDTIQLELHEWRPSALPIVKKDFAGFVEELPAPGAAHFSRKMALAARADCPKAVGPVRQDGLLRIVPMSLSPKRDADRRVRFTTYVANPVVAADADAGARAATLLLELPDELPIFAVAWSYDRSGQRQDMEGQAREVRIECSRDGKTWSRAAREPVQAGDRHGKAVPFPSGTAARYLRLRFVDGAGWPTVISCDEIEVF